MTKDKAITLVSGGMDSCVATAIAHAEGFDIYALHVNYKQRTMERELEAFNDIASFYKIPEEKRLIVDINHLGQIGGSALTDESISVPKANLEYEGIPQSYVPFRNCHILAVGVSWGEVVGATKIFIGAVEQDSSGYPDCRPEYYKVFNKLIEVGTRPETHIEVITPLIYMSKRNIVLKGVELNAPLGRTWSCYQSNGPKACSTCDSCLLRLRGFYEAEIRDPILYEDDSVRTRF